MKQSPAWVWSESQALSISLAQTSEDSYLELCDHLVGRYPSLRVAYIDEVEETHGGKMEKVYYSALVKAAGARPENPAEPTPNLDQVTSLHLSLPWFDHHDFC